MKKLLLLSFIGFCSICPMKQTGQNLEDAVANCDYFGFKIMLDRWLGQGGNLGAAYNTTRGGQLQYPTFLAFFAENQCGNYNIHYEAHPLIRKKMLDYLMKKNKEMAKAKKATLNISDSTALITAAKKKNHNLFGLLLERTEVKLQDHEIRNITERCVPCFQQLLEKQGNSIITPTLIEQTEDATTKAILQMAAAKPVVNIIADDKKQPTSVSCDPHDWINCPARK